MLPALATAASSLGALALSHYYSSCSRDRGDRSSSPCGARGGANSVGDLIESYVAAGCLPNGVVGVYRGDDKEVYYYATGMADVEKKIPIARDSIFRIYSMTKPITVVAALILVDRGLLHLDDPVHRYIPSFKKATVFMGGDVDDYKSEPVTTHITIRHLMMHTSGLAGYGVIGLGSSPIDKILASKCEDWKNSYSNTSLEAFVDILADTPLSFQPGTKWMYGWSTDVLGRVIEVISKLSLDEFFQHKIFEPLKMYDTSFHVSKEKLPRLAECYDFRPGFSYAKAVNAERVRDKKKMLLSGGGGLCSTLDDYAAFCQCLMRGGKTADGKVIISVDLVKAMYTNQLPGNTTVMDFSFDTGGFSESIGPGIGFGLGVATVTDPAVGKATQMSNIGEYGWGGVASTTFWIDPVDQVMCIFMTQLIPSSVYPFRAQLKWLVRLLLERQ